MTSQFRLFGLILLLVTTSGCCLPTPMCFRPPAERWSSFSSYGIRHPQPLCSDPCYTTDYCAPVQCSESACGWPITQTYAANCPVDTACGCQECVSETGTCTTPTTQQGCGCKACGAGHQHTPMTEGCGESAIKPVPDTHVPPTPDHQPAPAPPSDDAAGLQQTSWSTQAIPEDQIPVLHIPGEMIEAERLR